MPSALVPSLTTSKNRLEESTAQLLSAPTASSIPMSVLPRYRSLRLSALQLCRLVQAGVQFPHARRLEVEGCLPAGMEYGFLESRYHFLASFPSLRHLVLTGGRHAPLLPVWDLAGWDQLRILQVHACYGDVALWKAWTGLRVLRLDLSDFTPAEDLVLAWANLACLRRLHQLTVVQHTFSESADFLAVQPSASLPHLSSLTTPIHDTFWTVVPSASDSSIRCADQHHVEQGAQPTTSLGRSAHSQRSPTQLDV